MAGSHRRYGISESAFFNSGKKYGGLDVSKLCTLKTLEEEIRCLKKNVADMELDLEPLKALL